MARLREGVSVAKQGSCCPPACEGLTDSLDPFGDGAGEIPGPAAAWACASQCRSSPLVIAAYKGHLAVVAAGAAVDPRDPHGRTPLWVASWTGHLAVVSSLLAAGADVDLANNVGETPLFFAAEHGREAVVSSLLAAGADVDLPDQSGRTPLRVAVTMGRLRVASILRAAGADPAQLASAPQARLEEYEAYREQRIRERFALLAAMQRQRSGLTEHLARMAARYL